MRAGEWKLDPDFHGAVAHLPELPFGFQLILREAPQPVRSKPAFSISTPPQLVARHDHFNLRCLTFSGLPSIPSLTMWSAAGLPRKRPGVKLTWSPVLMSHSGMWEFASAVAWKKKS